MTLCSLLLQSNLMFQSLCGQIKERSNYVVVSTPDNPTYIWGNYLILSAPPAAQTSERWAKIFEQEFVSAQAVKHMALTWAGTGPFDAGEWTRKGFSVGQTTGLNVSAVPENVYTPNNIEFRPIMSDDEWQMTVELQVLVSGGPRPDLEYRRFMQIKFENYRAMIRAGQGMWLGAFQRGKLIADLGLFLKNDFARFQNVETHPAYRNRGVGRALVQTASLWALKRPGIKTLVIESDPGSTADRLYRSLGFVETEQVVSLELRDRTNVRTEF